MTTHYKVTVEYMFDIYCESAVTVYITTLTPQVNLISNVLLFRKLSTGLAMTYLSKQVFIGNYSNKHLSRR